MSTWKKSRYAGTQGLDKMIRFRFANHPEAGGSPCTLVSFIPSLCVKSKDTLREIPSLRKQLSGIIHNPDSGCTDFMFCMVDALKPTEKIPSTDYHQHELLSGRYTKRRGLMKANRRLNTDVRSSGGTLVVCFPMSTGLNWSKHVTHAVLYSGGRTVRFY